VRAEVDFKFHDDKPDARIWTAAIDERLKERGPFCPASATPATGRVAPASSDGGAGTLQAPRPLALCTPGPPFT